MGFFRKTGNFLGNFFDWRADRWIGASGIKESWKQTTQVLRDVARPTDASRIETFEESMTRQNLTEEDLITQQRAFNRLFLIFLFFTLGIYAYAIGMLINLNLFAFIIATVLGSYTLTHAFRYHFWLYQLKQRRLGCTFREWYEGTFGKSNKKPSEGGQ